MKERKKNCLKKHKVRIDNGERSAEKIRERKPELANIVQEREKGSKCENGSGGWRHVPTPEADIVISDDLPLQVRDLPDPLLTQ
jgi:hypothetical protein